jgi:nucleotide-binding universal stress UspA family protein
MGKVVVGVDGSEGSLIALRFAVTEARLRNARLEIVYAWHVPAAAGPFGSSTSTVVLAGEVAEAAEQVAAHAAEAARQEGGTDLQVDAVAVMASPAAELVDRSKDADLLVVGRRGLGGFAGLLLGSVSHQCVQHAHCPVAVVHRTDTVAEAPRSRHE